MSSRLQRSGAKIRRLIVFDTVRELCEMDGSIPPGVREISRELELKYPKIFGGWPALNSAVGLYLSQLAKEGRLIRSNYEGIGNVYEVVR